MRDPNRIEPFIAALATWWYKHPDWRFGQLICNTLYAGIERGKDLEHRLFFMEDDEAQAQLNYWIMPAKTRTVDD